MGLGDIFVDGVGTPFRALVNSGNVDEPVFAFYLGSGGADGELTIGGLNSAHYTGDFHYVPVVPMIPVGHFDGISSMGLDDISVDGVETPLRALVNSGKLVCFLPWL